MNITFVIIDDTESIKEHTLLYTLEDRGYKTEFFSKPDSGLNFILDSLDINMIVLLDIQFSNSDVDDGHSILKKINDKSELIPVILWSGINETEESFGDFINNNAFGFISKSATIKESMMIIEKAINFLRSSLDNIIEDWIIAKDADKDKPIYITSNGKSYTLNDILTEIRLQTSVGKEFSTKLNSLTIDLLLRNKENLNG